MNAKLMLIISMAVFGTIGLVNRYIPISSGELALCRAIMASILIMIYLGITKQKIDIKSIKKEIPLLLASGMAMGVNWILLFQAYNYTTISAATLSYYFAPVIVTAVCPFLFREKMTMKQIICFVMSTVGLVMIIGVENLDQGGNDLKGILFGLGAACFYATVILLNKFIKNVEGIHRTLLQFFAAIIILVPYVAVTGGVHLEVLDTTGWIALLTIGLIHTGVTYCMYFSALKELTGQEASILSYIDPLIAVVCSVVILHEPMTVMQAIGGVFILGFTLWNEKK
ncbi:MAG: EamA family transporter [Firmicutes bacterium]|nr:EamA family transporter [Bacillota bacterium]